MNKIYILFFVLIGCRTTEPSFVHRAVITTHDSWQFKDIEKDSISGIGLERLYLEAEPLKKKSKKKEIIIALLDCQINTNHEDLMTSFWKNTKEIANNGIDDDKNGYIDDIDGWNFLGNSKGEQLIWATYAHIRTLNAYKSTVNKKESLVDSIQYQKSVKHLEKKKFLINDNYEYVRFLKNGYPKAKKAADSLFKHSNYTVKDLDSVYRIIKPENSTLRANIYFLSDFMKYNMYTMADKIYTQTKLIEQKLNNQNYNARSVLGDDFNDFNDRNYGNTIVNGNLDTNTHGTKVTGVLAANRDNNIGIKGIYSGIRIMPVVMTPAFGAEYDKDIALAIRYAVDNGAKVISYSSSKYFSLHNNWVQEALQYANKHQVIFVRSAGNNSKNNDTHIKYPNDEDPNYTLHNFIVVGAINKHSKKSRQSNYGKKTVDLFAPGVDIYTTTADGGYQKISGTSMAAPLVAGVVALLFSYYPELTAKEVKEIILKATYKPKGKVLVNKKTKQMLSYNEMCTSGGFLNAYNAFLLAEKYVKRKK